MERPACGVDFLQQFPVKDASGQNMLRRMQANHARFWRGTEWQEEEKTHLLQYCIDLCRWHECVQRWPAAAQQSHGRPFVAHFPWLGMSCDALPALPVLQTVNLARYVLRWSLLMSPSGIPMGTKENSEDAKLLRSHRVYCDPGVGTDFHQQWVSFLRLFLGCMHYVRHRALKCWLSFDERRCDLTHVYVGQLFTLLEALTLWHKAKLTIAELEKENREEEEEKKHTFTHVVNDAYLDRITERGRRYDQVCHMTFKAYTMVAELPERLPLLWGTQKGTAVAILNEKSPEIRSAAADKEASRKSKTRTEEGDSSLHFWIKQLRVLWILARGYQKNLLQEHDKALALMRVAAETGVWIPELANMERNMATVHRKKVDESLFQEEERVLRGMPSVTVAYALPIRYTDRPEDVAEPNRIEIMRRLTPSV